MSRSESSANSESSVDIHTLDESNHLELSNKVSPNQKTNSSLTNSASNAKSLTFSISRLLDYSSSPKCTETEDETDDKSCISEAESPSSLSNYSMCAGIGVPNCVEVVKNKESMECGLKMSTTSYGLSTGFELGQMTSSASSPTNSVIRVPAHRPTHSSMAYSVTYPWLAQTSAPFIKDGLPSKFTDKLIILVHTIQCLYDKIIIKMNIAFVLDYYYN